MAKKYATYKLKWNLKAFSEMRNFNTIQGYCLKAAKNGLQATGVSSHSDFACDVRPGKKRCHAMIKTTSYEGMRLDHQDNVLLKALGATGLPLIEGSGK